MTASQVVSRALATSSITFLLLATSSVESCLMRSGESDQSMRVGTMCAMLRRERRSEVRARAQTGRCPVRLLRAARKSINDECRRHFDGFLLKQSEGEDVVRRSAQVT